MKKFLCEAERAQRKISEVSEAKEANKPELVPSHDPGAILFVTRSSIRYGRSYPKFANFGTFA